MYETDADRAYDLREAADDAERLAAEYKDGVREILLNRAARLRWWADSLAPDTRSFTVTMSPPDGEG